MVLCDTVWQKRALSKLAPQVGISGGGQAGACLNLSVKSSLRLGRLLLGFRDISITWSRWNSSEPAHPVLILGQSPVSVGRAGRDRIPADEQNTCF